VDFEKGNTKCKIICISKLCTYEVGGMILVATMDLLLGLKAYKQNLEVIVHMLQEVCPNKVSHPIDAEATSA
jgi:hypothetical protein